MPREGCAAKKLDSYISYSITYFKVLIKPVASMASGRSPANAKLLERLGIKLGHCRWRICYNPA